MKHQVLKLDVTGTPEKWITQENACRYYAMGAVAWTIGQEMNVFHGGFSSITGCRSLMAIHPIIAVQGTSRILASQISPSLTNDKLFRRDRNTCVFCGERFPSSRLTRDHIIPRARGGEDTWMNVASACRPCNAFKGCRTPEEAGMPLLFAPYKPSHWEDLLLQGRRVLADQHEFLAARLPSTSRIITTDDSLFRSVRHEG